MFRDDPTPWGEAQHIHDLCPGAFMVSTASHGGVMIARDADAPPVDVKIGQDNGMEKPVKMEIANMPTKLVFEKLDALTGKPPRALASATDAALAAFRLLNEKGEAVKLTALDGGGLRPSTEGKEAFAVDTNGIAKIFYLPTDSYSVEEVTAPTGYGIAAPVKIEVKG